MKKIFALLIALLMVATLVACANDDTGNPLESLGANDNSYTDEDCGKGTFTYEASEDGHYEITGYSVNNADLHELEIPAEINEIAVTSIADEAFKSCNYITSVTIPDTVKYIGDFAFYDCDKLEKVNIADSVQKLGVGVFRDCAILNNVALPEPLVEIPDQLFWNCPSLSAISSGKNIEVIGIGAFYNCDAFTAISFPSTVKEIGEMAFYGCDNLVNIAVPASVEKVGDTAFSAINAEKVNFLTIEGSYFESFFEATYGINEKDYPHYELKTVK